MHDAPLQDGTCVAKLPSLIVREPAVSGACAPGSKVPGGVSGPDDTEPALPPDDAPPAPLDPLPASVAPASPADASVAGVPPLAVPPVPEAPPVSDLPPDACAPPLDFAPPFGAIPPGETAENRESSPLQAANGSAKTMIQPQVARTPAYSHD